MERQAGTGYYIEPASGPGPGLLVLHSWWGLTNWFREVANGLADDGYSVLVPDLLGGALPQTSAEAEVVLLDADMDRMAALVHSSVHALRSHSRDPHDPVGALGFAMGASWSMWLSARLGESIRTVVGFYGTQNIDFDASVADYQLHYGDADEVVTDDEVAETLAFLALSERPVEVFRYANARHCFMEPHAGTFDEPASNLAWDRAKEFLGARLLSRPRAE